MLSGTTTVGNPPDDDLSSLGRVYLICSYKRSRALVYIYHFGIIANVFVYLPQEKAAGVYLISNQILESNLGAE